MPKAKNTQKTQTQIPLYTEWNKAVDTRYYLKGTDIEVVKSNKTTKLPKQGAQPLFRYKNRKDAIGDWYNGKDIVMVDKVAQAENKRFSNELEQSLLAGKITQEQLVEALKTVGVSL